MAIGRAFPQHPSPRLEADAGTLSKVLGPVIVDLEAGLTHEEAVEVGRDRVSHVGPAAFGIGDDKLAAHGYPVTVCLGNGQLDARIGAGGDGRRFGMPWVAMGCPSTLPARAS